MDVRIADLSSSVEREAISMTGICDQTRAIPDHAFHQGLVFVFDSPEDALRLLCEALQRAVDLLNRFTPRRPLGLQSSKQFGPLLLPDGFILRNSTHSRFHTTRYTK